jgi:hypothetical protein
MLRDEEIRRFVGYLKKVVDAESLAAIEDELRSEDGNDLLREPDFLRYFPTVEIKKIIGATDWRLRIIPYTKMRMVQRGIDEAKIESLFVDFIKYCRESEEIITAGAYTIFAKPITLRIDVDKVSDEKGEAHAVTVFIGSGDVEDTLLVVIEQ